MRTAVAAKSAQAPASPMTAGDRKKKAQQFVTELINHGMSTEAIAVALGVNNHTVIRWRDAQTAPQPGAMERLHRLHLTTFGRLPAKFQK